MGLSTRLVWALLAVACTGAGGADALDRLRSAAIGGDVDAAFRLGRAYKLGDGAPADAKQAERWFEKAAQLGHAKGGDELGLVLLQNGKARDALPWLTKAAERGDARAQYGLATLLFGGAAGTIDVKQARIWMRRAARSGLPAAVEALAVMEKPNALAPEAPRTYEIVTVKPAPPALTPAPAPRTQPGQWTVQLGAFARPDNARRYWRLVRGEVGLKAAFVVREGLTRLRLGPFATQDAARRFCATQRRQDRECFEVRSQSGGAKGG